ncbi:MAG: Lrp/AsnC ligand binding domain-containing protein [Candidatus Thermoplasmatota archaeon]|nr:Lrp/AsnC ligand binding domain-containing protein [Candidatus Thermoplasmatota archaeon]
MELSTAFVLIKTKPMKEAEVYRALLGLENVVETHVVYGEYDLAARIDFKDDKEMSRILMGDFRKIPGVEQTETLIAVEV